jgi:ABC-type enterobactin transport system permease subunit
VVFERRLPRVAPVVLMAAGLGLIGAVIRISLEAV